MKVLNEKMEAPVRIIAVALICAFVVLAAYYQQMSRTTSITRSNMCPLAASHLLISARTDNRHLSIGSTSRLTLTLL
jgi:hypothetical protein